MCVQAVKALVRMCLCCSHMRSAPKSISTFSKCSFKNIIRVSNSFDPDQARRLVQGGTSFVDHLCYLCLVFVMHLRLFIAALWSHAGKGLTSWPLFVMFNCVFVTFPCGILGQACYLFVPIPDLCRLSYIGRSIQNFCLRK